jgi:hypothetical protein
LFDLVKRCDCNWKLITETINKEVDKNLTYNQIYNRFYFSPNFLKANDIDLKDSKNKFTQEYKNILDSHPKRERKLNKEFTVQKDFIEGYSLKIYKTKKINYQKNFEKDKETTIINNDENKIDSIFDGFDIPDDSFVWNDYLNKEVFE